MKPMYEEKTFESYFNNELDCRASIYFPFGQVQEGGIGADASAFSRNRYLWRKFGYPFWFNIPFEGVNLGDIAQEMEYYLGKEIKNIPNIKTNILFQYKRPKLIKTKAGVAWKYWNRKYFMYEIYKEQQELLSHISSNFGSKALVLYAAPAVEGVDDLIEFKQKKSIIENTNFRPASDLAAHHINTYIKAGTYSIACSDPERFENFNLLDKLKHIESNQEIDSKESIIDFSNSIQLISENYSFHKAYEKELNTYYEYGIEKNSLFYSLLAMEKFKEITGIQWILAVNKA